MRNEWLGFAFIPLFALRSCASFPPCLFLIRNLETPYSSAKRKQATPLLIKNDEISYEHYT